MTFTIGDKVIWTRIPSGGYGFAEHVPATVVRVTATNRVTIDAELANGSTKRVSVRNWKLRLRDQ